MNKKADTRLPKTLSDYIEAVVRDYPRRASALEVESLSEPTRKQYLVYNVAVDMAIDFLEPALKKILIDDIIEGRSYYSSSAANFICRNSYYKRRSRILYNVAVALKMA